MRSRFALILIATIWFILGFGYYPKWKKPWSEAAISWDVSGYYHYLPAIFIYHDLRQQNWMPGINQQYLPSPAYDQAFGHKNSGNKVNKYAIGQALLYSPFFLTAHAWTKLTHAWPADGYSLPYQFSIWAGGFLVSVLGLILLRKILRLYVEDKVVAWVLIALGLATHWMEYASITNGMNHTWLFTILCGLILSTIRFYRRADWISAIGIGLCMGLAVLTRPTEIIWVFVPLLWGLVSPGERLHFLTRQWKKVLLAGCLACCLVLIQPIYWKYASGEWIVYTYGDQGFNWLHPKIWRGLMGVNIGWWVYTPLMLVAMAGWPDLYRQHRSVFWAAGATSLLAVYITLSWAHFESGGGLGQRNLIQVYPLLAFLLAVVIRRMVASVSGQWLWYLLLAANLYYNGWWIHQAHKGGFFQAGQMNTPYFLHVAGRLHPDRNLFKLLDTREYFAGIPVWQELLWEHDFETDSLACAAPWPAGGRAACLDQEHQQWGPVKIPVGAGCAQWIRCEGDFVITSREWDVWKYAQWIIQFYQGDQVIKTNLIRVQRLQPLDHTPIHLFFDVRMPEAYFTRCTMSLWNGGSAHSLFVDNLRVSCIR